MMPSDATVYVIDDDEAARDSLAFLLKTANLDVKTFESAAAFLEVASNLKSGYQVLENQAPDMRILRKARASFSTAGSVGYLLPISVPS